jgi:hypothetical protein
MTSTEERIKEIARARAIPESEAAELLAAVRPKTSGKRSLFDRWSGEVTSIAGVVVALAGVATSRLGVRYDGALDLHIVPPPVALRAAIVDQVVAVGLTAVIMWAVARAFARNVRVVDVLGAVGVSRLPAVVASVPLALLVPLVPMPPGKPNAAVFVVALVALFAVGLQVYLLVLGFRTATGLRGGRLAKAFVAALVAAEILAKLALGIF